MVQSALSQIIETSDGSLSSNGLIRPNQRSGPILTVVSSFHLARRNVIYRAKRKLSLISGYIRPKKMHQSMFTCAQSPTDNCGAFVNFVLLGGRTFANPRGHPRAFDTHVVSYPNITTQRILLRFHWKRADRLIRQGREKLQL